MNESRSAKPIPQHPPEIRPLSSGFLLNHSLIVLIDFFYFALYEKWYKIFRESTGMWLRGCSKPTHAVRKHRKSDVSVLSRRYIPDFVRSGSRLL